MTTVFGLKHPEVNLGVLVADRQGTLSNEQGIPIGKRLWRKIWKSNKDNYCFGHTGTMDKGMNELVERLVNEDIDVEKVVSKEYFPELRKLNIKNMGKKVPDISKTSGLALITRFDNNPKLYTCFPLGKVEERILLPLGSGEQKINEYLQALQIRREARNYLNNEEPITPEDIIQIGLEAVRRSQSQDIYSHGLDMMIVDPEGIKDHYADLEDDFGKKLKNIQDKYKTLKKR